MLNYDTIARCYFVSLVSLLVGNLIRKGQQLIVCDPLLEIDLGCKSVNCDDEFGSVKQFGTVSFVIFLFFLSC